MTLIHIQLVTILQKMVSLLGGASDGFDDDDVVWCDYMFEIVYKISW